MIILTISFRDVDLKIFPVIKFQIITSKTSLFKTIIVSANDELVNFYKKIKFVDISKKLLKLLKSNEILKYKKIKYKSVRYYQIS